MNGKALFGAVFLATAVICANESCLAQLGPGILADANLPSGAPDPEKESRVWQVDPLTGALNVHIPFDTTPIGGRGPKIPFALLYNSSATVTLQSTGTQTTSGGDNALVTCYTASGDLCFLTATGGSIGVGAEITQTYTWMPGSAEGSPGPVGPWTTSGPFLYNSYTVIPDQTVQQGGTNVNNGSGCTVWGPYLFTDEDGSTHDMDIERASLNQTAGTTPSSACSTANTNSTDSAQGIAVDGSSLIAGNPPFGPNNNAPYLSVQYPNGTVVRFASDPYTIPHPGSAYPVYTIEDTNGNLASLSQDSVGRTPFSTNIPIGQPGQIPAGTYSVTTTDANGLSQQYKVVIANVSIGTYAMPHPTTSDFTAVNCISGVTCPTSYVAVQPTANATFPAVTSIELPNSTSYAFQYDPTYGTISRITFPTGGYVRFQYGIRTNEGAWGNYTQMSSITVTDVFLSDPISGEDHWSYCYSFSSPCDPRSGTFTSQSTVIAPDGTKTTYTGVPFWFINYFVDGARPTWKVASEQVSNSKGALIKSTSYAYNGQGLTTQIVTSLYDGGVNTQSQQVMSYDAWNNAVEKDESDLYSCSGTPCPVLSVSAGGWKRKTFTTYQYQNNPAWITSHIVNKPSQVLITDGAGHPFSITKFGYDETAVTNGSGYLNHDDTYFGSSSRLPRGNLTSESHCTAISPLLTFNASNASSAKSSCSGLWLTTQYQYDPTGQVTQKTDPNNNQTTFGYTDTWASGGPTNTPLTGSTTSQTDAYLTQVTRPGGYIDLYSYDYPSGQMASHTDKSNNPNNPTVYSYNDPNHMSRQTGTTYPDGGSVGISYSDTTPPSITVTAATGEAAGPIVQVTNYDELGRVQETNVTSDAGANIVMKTYDNMGRLQSVTNPYRKTSDSTYGITSFLYDAIGRKTYQCQPDNSLSQSSVCSHSLSFLSWSYMGNCVIFQDENGNQWKRCSNGIGQLTSVLEPSGASTSPTMETDYSYDPLNNLTSVQQCGAQCPTATSRARGFTYDNMSRLLTSYNPETGTTCYGLWNGGQCTGGYDGNGNLVYKTDARGVITNSQYDSLNHLIKKYYSSDASNTPSTCYLYGPSSNVGFAGRLISEWTQPANSSNSCGTAPSSGYYTMRSVQAYDRMGRILNERQYTPASIAAGTYYAPQYQYDLAGRVVYTTDGVTIPKTRVSLSLSCGMSGPSWTTLTLGFCFDGGGHLQMVGSNWVDPVHPQTLFAAPSTSTQSSYAAFGGLINASVGNGLTLNRTFDMRLRTLTETDTGSTVSTATAGTAVIKITGAEQSK